MARACRFPKETRRMALSDNSWSHMLLPLKRYNDQNFMETGYLMDPVPDGQPAIVRLGNIWMPKPMDLKLEYPNVDAMIADGWEVD